MAIFKSKYKEFVNPKEEFKEPSGVSWVDIFSGSILTSKVFVGQMPIIALLVLFSIVYITLRNYTEENYRKKDDLEQEVRELRNESISITSDLMYISKRSEVLKRIRREGIDLSESDVPPVKIYIGEE